MVSYTLKNIIHSSFDPFSSNFSVQVIPLPLCLLSLGLVSFSPAALDTQDFLIECWVVDGNLHL